jgi:hypothetical protein
MPRCSTLTQEAARRVRGILFVDYVRMIRGRKDLDWSGHLQPDDLAFLDVVIDPAGWYPMETFERMGDAILQEIGGGQLEAVRMWGRFQTDAILRIHPNLVSPGNPEETLSRFRVLHRGFFDYDAIDIPEVLLGEARIAIAYGMGASAEEAACHQAMGFFERLVEVAGGAGIYAAFRRRGWVEGPPTELSISWKV